MASFYIKIILEISQIEPEKMTMVMEFRIQSFSLI